MLTGRCEVERALGEPPDARQNLVGGFRPDKGSALGVVRLDELADRRFQRGDASMHAAPQLLGGQLGEPALNEVQPGSVGRGEVDVEPRSFGASVIKCW